jgi:predicted AAA+ superfamily ATPase
MKRYLESQVRDDLKQKMVFVGGPRQVGKTTLSRAILKNSKGIYLNWDRNDHRSLILEDKIPHKGLLVLDEIHKYRKWRNWIKGIYDTEGKTLRILVTGSARLDLYRYGGDSLQGRYHYLRLHPLSVAEAKINNQSLFKSLLHLGGFPEPFLGQSETNARRWSREHRSRIVREEIASLEATQDLATLERMALRLPDLIGSPLSLNALREDLQVAHATVAKWLQILERVYMIFRISPLGGPKIRAVKKEQKHYHWDWSVIPELPQRFENLMASHLLKWIHWQEDTQGWNMELRYFRDTDGREVDFVILKEGRPTHLIECKWSDGEVSKHLEYLKAKYPEAHAYQIHFDGTADKQTKSKIRIIPALRFLKDYI